MAKRNQYKPHQNFGGWKLLSRLGAGGQGQVWSAQQGGSTCAIKLLKSIRPATYSRFKSEVAAIQSNQDIDGVIPLIDMFLPEDVSKTVPWLVMPVASSFSKWRKEKEIGSVVEEMVKIAQTLTELHERGVHHRDIKPANLLYLNERLYLSDFGLVTYPNKENITPLKHNLGPKLTMAPEMRREATEADGELADIYSFAKTLWIAIVGDDRCFDGQYSQFSAVSINAHCPGLYTKTLNDLLAEATDHVPENRPRMKQVVERLKSWLAINDNFHDKNLTQWFDLQNKLFPAGSPSSVTWTNTDDIVTVMKEIAHVKSLNHMFYPGGGGNTFIDVDLANEHGFIEIKIADKLFDLVKVKKLSYESFGLDPKWNYFRIESEDIDLTGVYEKGSLIYSYEDLVEITPCRYVERYHWDNYEYQGERLGDEARLTCRYFKGSFVIFSTRSPYNLTPSTYDGRHDNMTESEFRQHIQHSAKGSKGPDEL